MGIFIVLGIFTSISQHIEAVEIRFLTLSTVMRQAALLIGTACGRFVLSRIRGFRN